MVATLIDVLLACRYVNGRVIVGRRRVSTETDSFRNQRVICGWAAVSDPWTGGVGRGGEVHISFLADPNTQKVTNERLF